MLTATPASASVAPPSGGNQARWSVSPDQWPYDTARVAAALARVENPQRVLVGIADGGLGGAGGAPIPPELLLSRDETPNEADDDGSGYLDDVHGAGIARRAVTYGHGVYGDGDLRLCNGDVAALARAQPGYASHGSVVSWIASGGRLWSRKLLEDRWLPRLTFFRLLDVCSPAGPFDVQPGHVVSGIEWLLHTADAKIVNLSAAADPSTFRSEAATIEKLLHSDDRLLVLAAGNQGAKLDDEATDCLACLVALEPVSRRVFLVGSAEPDLTRSPLSNHGPRVVFYAPGTAEGALAIDGQPFGFSPVEFATSYATPHVTLALQMLRMAGITNNYDLRQRLLETSWPLRDGIRDDRQAAWVVDLTKVAAIRDDSVEAIQVDADGVARRRTWVGRIVSDRENLPLCLGQPISFRPIRAVRIDPEAQDDRRSMTIFHRKRLPPGTRWKRSDGESCRLPGEDVTIDIDDLVAGATVRIPARTVTAVVFNER